MYLLTPLGYVVILRFQVLPVTELSEVRVRVRVGYQMIVWKTTPTSYWVLQLPLSCLLFPEQARDPQ